MQITQFTCGALATNCYVVTLSAGRCLIIDIGADSLAIDNYLQQNELTPIAILLTHGHFDHIAGVERVRAKYNVPVYIHRLDAPYLTDSALNLGDEIAPGTFSPIKEWNEFEDGAQFSFDGTEWRVMLTPGHTPGSVCFQCENCLFTGDTLFKMSRGRTDFPGGSTAAIYDSLKKLSLLPDDYHVFPGHGECTTLSAERARNPEIRRKSNGD